jgi:hypothetical protein
MRTCAIPTEFYLYMQKSKIELLTYIFKESKILNTQANLLLVVFTLFKIILHLYQKKKINNSSSFSLHTIFRQQL